VWFKIAQKDSGMEPDVLDSALCFGWIDGRREALDERYFLQRVTRRRPRSKWWPINRDKRPTTSSASSMRARRRKAFSPS
jgi:uncharacterized protein YdeI (YjbR/CyaY-like superfamily)